MKLVSVIKKSIKEQYRSFWILLLTISMAPFFVFVYYLIYESSKPEYELVIVNNDLGKEYAYGAINHGNYLIESMKMIRADSIEIPLKISVEKNRGMAVKKLKNKGADALVVLPGNFSEAVHQQKEGIDSLQMQLELVGDQTDLDYMVSAVWAGELINGYIYGVTGKDSPYQLKETSLGFSANQNDFNLAVPGLLILSIIMLMFTASITLVSEVEKKTLFRLKLSRINTFQFLAGAGVVQVVVGVIAVLLTLLVAGALGFEMHGKFGILLLFAILASISIIAFSLIISAATKSVNEVLVIGNFPLFLFMFFSGAMFPVDARAWFSIGGYDVSVISLMSSSHAIQALKKTLVLGAGLGDVIPELIALVVITILYFLVGWWLFKRRHMRVG